MNIQHHIQVILSSPVDDVLDICEAVLLIGAVLFLYEIVVNGNTDVIHAPGGDLFNIFFVNEIVVTLFGMVTL